MSAPLVPDDLWEAIAPLLLREPPKPRGGRPRLPNHATLAGIAFALAAKRSWSGQTAIPAATAGSVPVSAVREPRTSACPRYGAGVAAACTRCVKT